MVLGGLVNKEIVNLLNQNQGRAIGVSGKDGKLIKAKKLRLKQKKQRLTDEIIDIGHVGEVVGINTEILDVMKDSNFIPVIAQLGQTTLVLVLTLTQTQLPARLRQSWAQRS